ncbi:MAG: hypothetical protein PX637_23135, partial [Microcystis sp. M53601_WE4]|nr:hypothetical protein [Microcystis sp. M53601_WE4]
AFISELPPRNILAMAKSLTEPELKFNFLVFLYGASTRILTPNPQTFSADPNYILASKTGQ